MSLKAISFDLWFTLIWDDSSLEEYYRVSKIKAIKDTLKELSFEDIEKAFKGVRGNRGEDLPPTNFEGWIKSLLDNLGYKADENLIKDLALKVSFSGFDKLPYLNPEAKEVLSYFKSEGYKIALISNVNRYSIAYKELLRKLEILDYFDSLIFSSDLGFAKPDKEIFYEALKELKVKKEEMVHIGDSYYHDVLGANNAGIKAILYIGLWDKFEEARKVKREKPSYPLIAKNLKDCIEMVKKMV